MNSVDYLVLLLLLFGVGFVTNTHIDRETIEIISTIESNGCTNSSKGLDLYLDEAG